LSVQSSNEETSTESDGDLIRLAKDGDETAFDSLVRRHADRLLRMVRNLTSCREDAEDVTQEALAAAYFKLDSFAGRSSFFTWVYRIALNKAISKRRLRRIETTHQSRNLDDAPAVEDPQAATESLLEQRETAEMLREAIARLEPDRRSVLVLRDCDGRDYAEIAEILNIPIGTVRSRLHRARCELRTMLETKECVNDTTQRVNNRGTSV
jgi:RNA polymerase sigma-70 factor (ECF subfamily)